MEPQPKAPIKVIRAISRMNIGGVQRGIIETLAAIDRERFDPEVLILSQEQGPWESALESLDIPVEHLFRRSYPWAGWFKCFRHSFRMARWLRERRPHVLHIHQAKPALFMVMAGRMARVPCILVHHHSIYTEHFWATLTPRRMRQEIRTAHKADGVIAVSEPVARASMEALRLPENKVFVAPNGIGSMPACILEKARQESVANIPDPPTGTRIIGGIGRLIPDKRWEDLIDAARIVIEREPNCEFWIVGGDEKNKQFAKVLEKRIQDRGLSGKVKLPGYQDRMPPIMARLDVGVLCSRREGCPNIILEFLSAGVPAVVSDIPSNLELVEPGETALVSRLEDVESLADCILKILENKELAESLRQKGQAKARKSSWENTARNYAKIYETILAAKGPQARARESRKHFETLGTAEREGVIVYGGSGSDGNGTALKQAIVRAADFLRDGRTAIMVGKTDPEQWRFLAEQAGIAGKEMERLNFDSISGEPDQWQQYASAGYGLLYCTATEDLEELIDSAISLDYQVVLEWDRSYTRAEVGRRINRLGDYHATLSYFQHLVRYVRRSEARILEKADGLVCGSSSIAGRLRRLRKDLRLIQLDAGEKESPASDESRAAKINDFIKSLR